MGLHYKLILSQQAQAQKRRPEYKWSNASAARRGQECNTFCIKVLKCHTFRLNERKGWHSDSFFIERFSVFQTEQLPMRTASRVKRLKTQPLSCLKPSGPSGDGWTNRSSNASSPGSSYIELHISVVRLRECSN